MTNDDSFSQILDRAADAVEARKYTVAKKLAKEALEIEPNSAEALVIYAISLAGLNEPKACDDTFRRAIDAAPDNPKVYFNFAVFLLSIGKEIEALEMAREAMVLDVGDEPTKNLIKKIEGKLGPANIPEAFEPGLRGNPKVVDLSTGPVHSIPWMSNIEPAWTSLGIGLAIVGALAFLGLLKVYLPGIIDSTRTGHPVVLQHTLLNTLISVAGYVAFGGGILFVLFDAMDRRKSFIWVMIAIFTSCLGLNFLTVIAYLLVGRKLDILTKLPESK